MAKIVSSVIAKLLKVSFRLLYHQLAWCYDCVAWIVSFGRWRKWTNVIFSYVNLHDGGRVLELGFGPGHLQIEMQKRGITCIGIDESRQMCNLARRRFTKAYPGVDLRLLRCVAEQLPLAECAIDAVISTFPSEYIFNESVIAGCHRVMRQGANIVILMGAQPGGISIFNRILRFLYRASDLEFQTLLGPEHYLDRLRSHGFDIKSVTILFENDKLSLIFGHKV